MDERPGDEIVDFGLTGREIELLRSALHGYADIEEVRVFGSRAKGCHRPGSDIDLAVRGPADDMRAARIELELNELPLPFRIEVKRYDGIVSRTLREHIDRRGIVLYQR